MESDLIETPHFHKSGRHLLDQAISMHDPSQDPQDSANETGLVLENIVKKAWRSLVRLEDCSGNSALIARRGQI